MRIPNHVAIIPDGNRRWAVQNGMNKQDGYDFGLMPGVEILRMAKAYGIQELTFYGFTTDNTHRPPEQVEAFRASCVRAFHIMQREGCQLLVLGNTDSALFPPELLPYTEIRCPSGDSALRVNFLINYGWEWDLSKMNTSKANRKEILSNLCSHDVPMIDLIVRWGGHTRLSGLLPVQSVYADFFCIDTMWPDFSMQDFSRAIDWYQHQDITRGG